MIMNSAQNLFRNLFLIFSFLIFINAWNPVSALAADVDWPEELRFGMYPAHDTESLLRESKPFFELLEKQIGIKVKGYVAHDYAALIEALRSNKLEGCFLGPFGYVLGREMAPISAVAVPVFPGGRTTYKSAVITRTESGINNLNDLKGKTFAFADPGSASGNLIPRYIMKQNNIDPERDFKTVWYSGNHDATLLAIKNRKVDAGALNYAHVEKGVLSGIIKEGEIKPILFSDPIPSSLIVVRANLPKDFQRKFKNAFLSLPPGDIGNWTGIEGFKETNDAAYEELDRIAKEMNMNASDVLKPKAKKKK